MRGVYLVAAELSRIGLIAFPTSRSARGADILATTTDLTKTFSIEVKTVTNQRFWQLSEHANEIRSPSHVYVFVHVKTSKKKDDLVTYYPVRSKFIADNIRRPNPDKPLTEQWRKGYSIDLTKNQKWHTKGIERFKNKWHIFGITVG
jgi:hypothetical protein